MKNKQNGNRMLTMGNSEAIAQATQQHQLKEDLYSDLTGLIVRGVKRDQQTGEDVYDCIQTGKNGSKSSYTPFSHLLLVHDTGLLTIPVISTPFQTCAHQRQLPPRRRG